MFENGVIFETFIQLLHDSTLLAQFHVGCCIVGIVLVGQNVSARQSDTRSYNFAYNDNTSLFDSIKLELNRIHSTITKSRVFL